MRKQNVFRIEDLKKAIKNEFGSLDELKETLIDSASLEYGNYYSEVTVGDCTIAYNSNPNIFAEYVINIPSKVYAPQLALGKDSVTEFGRKTGRVGRQYILDIK